MKSKPNHDHISNVHEQFRPRDAFKAGRTKCFRALYKCLKDEILEYNDYTKLYPWVMAKNPLPFGAVIVHKGKHIPDPI